jgi:hypothetical protein
MSRLLNVGRCPVCDWPLAESTEQGCTLDSCSYRPEEGSAEFYRIRDRRFRLEQLKARVKADNDLMDEIEASIEVDRVSVLIPSQNGGSE